MSKIKVNLDSSPVNGKQVSFIAPCNSADTECLVIEDVEYSVVDADGVSVAGIDNVWNSGALVSIILNVDTHIAFIQNANTNSYIEGALTKCAKTFTYTAEVHNVWTLDDDPNLGDVNPNRVSAVVYIAGIQATDNPIVDVVLGDDADANELYISSFAVVSRITTGDGYIRLYSYEGSPQVSFTIQLKVVR